MMKLLLCLLSCQLWTFGFCTFYDTIHPLTPADLKLGSTISVIGRMTRCGVGDCDVTIDFRVGSPPENLQGHGEISDKFDIALHARYLGGGEFIFNWFKDGSWRHEERMRKENIRFEPHVVYSFSFIVREKAFEINVNDTLIYGFDHRIPVESIGFLGVHSDFEVKCIRTETHKCPGEAVGAPEKPEEPAKPEEPEKPGYPTPGKPAGKVDENM